jgi:COMM domain containing 7
MQWKFGVTASTNEIDKLGNAFLLLRLSLNDGGKLKTEYMGEI